MKKVCYFGIYDPGHWRTRVVMRGFKKAGYKVVECRVNPREIRGLKKYVDLCKKYKTLNTNFDYVVVGFPGYLAVIFARIMTSGPIIFDAYISYFDGIRDRRNYSISHPMMWLAWGMDLLDGLLSDVVLTINYAYKDFFIKTLKVAEAKVEVLHKGADESVFYPRDKMGQGKRERYLVGWWGSFIPLHGLSTIVDAANILKNEREIEFQIIGSGQLVPQIKKQVEHYGLANFKMFSRIPQEALIEKISEFDIALGIFSASAKARRCVTNKVYEAMAMGKAIITEDSPANREIFTNGVNAYLVPPENPVELAKAIMHLIKDEKLRLSLEINARILFEKRFTSAKIENELIDILNRHSDA